MFKNYNDFLNESESLRHSLDERKDLRIGYLKYDKDCKPFLNDFREEFLYDSGYFLKFFFNGKIQSISINMRLLSGYNLDTNCPSLEFEDIKSVPKEWLSNKIDSYSAYSFLLSKIDPDFLGEEPEAAFHKNTLKAYQPEPSKEIQQFCNRHGYTITYTLFSLKNDKSPSAVARNGGYKNVGYTLIVTFVKDPEMIHKYRGSIRGKKFGLNEKLETKEEFEEKCTHYIWKDIPRKEQYTGHLVQISDYFGRGNSRISKDYQNKILWRDPRSNEYNASVLQFNMSDEDVKKYFRPITSTYLNSKKFGL